MFKVKEANKEMQHSKEDTEKIVKDIIKEVRDNGDDRVTHYEKKFGKTERAKFRLSDEEVEELISQLNEETKQLIETVVSRVNSFAEAQLQCIKPLDQEFGEGIRMGHNILPVEKVGAYVPGGRYPLLSSGPMVVCPAKIAGVEKIVACSPATYNGSIHPATVYGLKLAGADEIYAIGGAQAIAAMTYGTESVPEVDIISGPGNRFVAEAKRQVFGDVGIDMIAGPSEVIVLADEASNPKLCAADLLAQAEHDPNARAILISSSKGLADSTIREVEEQLKHFDDHSPVHDSWADMGEVIVVDSMNELVEISDGIAGEHVHIHCKDYKNIENELKNYGSLFINENSSVVFSDKVSGTNHTLPTNRAARFTGGLWVGSYLKVVTFQEIENEGIQYLASHAVKQSNSEGLHGHKESARFRLN